jgi:glycosyltransferase involved in cell wall biosynthesis
MIDSVNFSFELVDNFTTTDHIVSIPIFESKLEFSPEITIAIPTYKRAKYLKEAIDSAINQTGYSNYDIIVVDNNPNRNDETEKIMSLYKQNRRISYYKNAENIQMAGNWNRLYTLAKGKYVTMLHDDDLLYPNYLSSIIPIIERAEYDVYSPQSIAYNMLNNESFPVQIKANLKCVRVKPMNFLRGNIIGPSGMCMKRDFFIKTGGFSSQYDCASDFDYNVKISKHYKVCRIIGYPFFIYRIMENASCKTEIMLAGVKEDIAIKRGIIANKNIFIKTVWNCHFKVYPYINLDVAKLLFHNDNFDAKDELYKMGITYNMFDFLIYKSINYRYIFSHILKAIKKKFHVKS